MNQVFCKHLRTKRMYIEANPEAALADQPAEELSPCHYWCNLTQTAIGVDDRPVHKQSCNSSRTCFEE
jgi:hypothetical protein